MRVAIALWIGMGMVTGWAGLSGAQRVDPIMLKEMRQGQTLMQGELDAMKQEMQGAPAELADAMRAVVAAKQKQVDAAEAKVDAYEAAEWKAVDQAEAALLAARHELELAQLGLDEQMTVFRIREQARQAGKGVPEQDITRIRGLYGQARELRQQIQAVERQMGQLEQQRSELIRRVTVQLMPNPGER